MALATESDGSSVPAHQIGAEVIVGHALAILLLASLPAWYHLKVVDLDEAHPLLPLLWAVIGISGFQGFGEIQRKTHRGERIYLQATSTAGVEAGNGMRRAAVPSAERSLGWRTGVILLRLPVAIGRLVLNLALFFVLVFPSSILSAIYIILCCFVLIPLSSAIAFALVLIGSVFHDDVDHLPTLQSARNAYRLSLPFALTVATEPFRDFSQNIQAIAEWLRGKS